MISVIICTYNRADVLKAVLEDLARLVPPAGHDVEILVVDNNSKDDTAAMVKSVQSSGPFPVRYILERRQGQSHARNRGICEAKGNWLVFTDDDVQIAPNWLAALIRYAESANAAVIGGRVEPIWPNDLPKWVTKSGPYLQRIVFLDYNLGPESRPLSPDDPEPFGCNMAFRADMFRQHGLFRTDIGHTGKRIMGGEDTDMYARFRRAGMSLHYVADAVVRHPIEPERLRLTYLLRRKFWAGFGGGSTVDLAAQQCWMKIPRYIYRKFLYDCASLPTAALKADLPRATYHLGALFAHVGFACGAWMGRNSARTFAEGPIPTVPAGPANTV